MQNIKNTGKPAADNSKVQQASAPNPALGEAAHHPWRRLFACLLDFTLLPLILSLFFEALYLDFHPNPKIIYANLSLELIPFAATFIVMQIAVLIGSIMLMAAALQHTGTTPGKWLFGIKVIRQDGSYMSYRLSLKRELDVFIKGMWLTIPVVSLIPIWLSYQQLLTTGTTTWDRELGLSVHYRPDGVLQVCLNVIGVLLYLTAFNIYADLAFPLSGLLIADMFSR